MQLPPGLTEQDFLAAVERVIAILAGPFTFPGYSRDDVAQEIRMEAIRVIARYDPWPDADGRPTQPLDNYLFRCSLNFCIRLRRDRLRRTDAPCRDCNNDVPHDPTPRCAQQAAWKRRQDRKANLQSNGVRADMPEMTDRGPNPADEAGGRELLDLLDRRLPVELLPQLADFPDLQGSLQGGWGRRECPSLCPLLDAAVIASMVRRCCLQTGPPLLLHLVQRLLHFGDQAPDGVQGGLGVLMGVGGRFLCHLASKGYVDGHPAFRTCSRVGRRGIKARE